MFVYQRVSRVGAMSSELSGVVIDRRVKHQVWQQK